MDGGKMRPLVPGISVSTWREREGEGEGDGGEREREIILVSFSEIALNGLHLLHPSGTS